MIHLRLVAPPDCAQRVCDLLEASDAVVNVTHMPGASHKPDGDLVLADVAREEASVILSDLRELNLHHNGSIAMFPIDTAISDAYDEAERKARGAVSDAVVWEEVQERTSENAELSWSFVAFMIIATMIAAIGIVLDQPILIVGAMVVGPEYGPLAGLAVALVQLRGRLARRSLLALGVGFPAGILMAYLGSLLFKATGLAPADFAQEAHPLTQFISQPDAFSFVVAYLAGTAGVLSLTSAKSGALIGVLISVTTIPAAGNIGLAAAYGDHAEAVGALGQLTLNLIAITLAGIVTLYIQRLFYLSRRRRHLRSKERAAAGLGGPEAPGLDGSAEPASRAAAKAE